MSESRTPFSVLLTTYRGDDPRELDAALESTINQTHPPEEIVLVKDGPLTDKLTTIVESYIDRHPDLFSVHQLPENRGRGAAADIGLEHCSHDLVGIMSADDLNVPDRFEQQVKFLTMHSEVDVVGGYVTEFDEDPAEPIAIREVPTDPHEIMRFAKRRNPMNEVTVMFRKDVVLRVGGYRAVERMEDYDLWVRLLTNGATLANIPTILVHMRAGEELILRRGGLQYAREEIRQQTDFLRWEFITFPRFLYNISARVIIRILPNNIRGWLYRLFARG